MSIFELLSIEGIRQWEDSSLSSDQQMYCHRRTWKLLYDRQVSTLENKACQEFIQAIEEIHHLIQELPNLEEFSEELYGLSGWKIYPVSGLIDSQEYFNLLAKKFFPVSTFLRSGENLNYSPFPDLWHDIFGHIPLLLNPIYRDFIEAIVGQISKADEQKRKKIENIYWYTIEAGVCQEEGKTRVYGSSQLSSFEELNYVVSNQPCIEKFEVIKVGNSLVDIHQMQTTIFEIPYFNYLSQIESEIEQWIS